MITRLLIVGDPHAEAGDLEDCQALVDHVYDVAASTRAAICILGDLHHTHAVVHLDVMLFWYRFFERCNAAGIRVILLRGNHDAPGTEGSEAHALLTYMSQAHVVTSPALVAPGILAIPYYPHKEQVVSAARSSDSTKTLLCHNTFDGSVYENGHYAGDGVDPNLLPQEMIISGHIHTPQEFGKVWHPGAPRWRIQTDANVSRAVWLVDFDAEGRVEVRSRIDTGKVCRMIFALDDTPEAPAPEVLDPRHDWRICVRGPADFIQKRKVLFEAQGARVRTLNTTRRAAEVRESDGVGKAFEKWVGAYVPRFGTDRGVLQQMIEERLRGV